MNVNRIDLTVKGNKGLDKGSSEIGYLFNLFAVWPAPAPTCVSCWMKPGKGKFTSCRWIHRWFCRWSLKLGFSLAVLDSQRVKQRWARSPIQKALQWGDLVWRSLSDVGRSYEITSRLEVLAASYHGAAWWISRDLATVRRGVASKVHMAYHRILSVPSLHSLVLKM